jgi:hypothetical protein
LLLAYPEIRGQKHQHSWTDSLLQNPMEAAQPSLTDSNQTDTTLNHPKHQPHHPTTIAQHPLLPRHRQQHYGLQLCNKVEVWSCRSVVAVPTICLMQTGHQLPHLQEVLMALWRLLLLKRSLRHPSLLQSVCRLLRLYT